MKLEFDSHIPLLKGISIDHYVSRSHYTINAIVSHMFKESNKYIFTINVKSKF